jgi:hypothetical protein
MVHWWMMGDIIGKANYNEPPTTNAPVQDEAVQAVLGMNQKHILFPCSGIFQPQNFPLLPTSPFLPPSPHFVLMPSPKLGKVPEFE